MKVHVSLERGWWAAGAGERIMAMSSIAAARFQSAYQQSMPSVSSHTHGGHGQSFATIDAAGSNGPAATSATDKVGRKLDLTA
jgi:hypothetical protein